MAEEAQQEAQSERTDDALRAAREARELEESKTVTDVETLESISGPKRPGGFRVPALPEGWEVSVTLMLGNSVITVLDATIEVVFDGASKPEVFEYEDQQAAVKAAAGFAKKVSRLYKLQQERVAAQNEMLAGAPPQQPPN